jgi:hypothetical protein
MQGYSTKPTFYNIRNKLLVKGKNMAEELRVSEFQGSIEGE